MAYLNSMAQSCPNAANIAHYAELVRDRALRCALLAASGEVSEMALRPGVRSAPQVLDAAQLALAALAETRIARCPQSGKKAMVAHMASINARLAGDVGTQGIATGCTDIDRLLNGGPNRGNLVILGESPSIGKTVLSFEMQNGELLDRVLAGLGGIAWARCATASWTGSRGAASAAPSWNWTPRNLPGRAAGAVAAGRHRLLARYRDHDAFATQILSPRAAELVVLFLLVADLFTMSHVCDVEE
jgi:hypothetical protein